MKHENVVIYLTARPKRSGKLTFPWLIYQLFLISMTRGSGHLASGLSGFAKRGLGSFLPLAPKKRQAKASPLTCLARLRPPDPVMRPSRPSFTAFVAFVLACKTSTSQDEWTHRMVADRENKFHLLWTPSEEKIIFEIQVSGTGTLMTQ